MREWNANRTENGREDLPALFTVQVRMEKTSNSIPVSTMRKRAYGRYTQRIVKSSNRLLPWLKIVSPRPMLTIVCVCVVCVYVLCVCVHACVCVRVYVYVYVEGARPHNY